MYINLINIYTWNLTIMLLFGALSSDDGCIIQNWSCYYCNIVLFRKCKISRLQLTIIDDTFV